MKNILEQANDITYNRSEERDRQYGDFSEGIEIAAQIASLMSKKTITADDIYTSIIALKLSRESYNHKEDNLLDLVAYMSKLNDLRNEKNK